MLGQRILPALGARARVALLGTSHALARLVLQHAPGVKRLTHRGPAAAGWSPVLAHLLGTAWQPLAVADLELHVNQCKALPPPPPAGISRLVSHLRLERCKVDALAAWQLHDTELWPLLQHLTARDCDLAQPVEYTAVAQLQPIPGLQSFTWKELVSLFQGDPPLALLLPMAANATRLTLHTSYLSHLAAQALRRLQRLTHAHVVRVEGEDVVLALLQHPTLEHVVVGDFSDRVHWTLDLDLRQRPCRWRTLTIRRYTFVSVAVLGCLPLHGLEQLSIHWGLRTGSDHGPGQPPSLTWGLHLLQQLHAAGRLQLHPGCDARERDCGMFRLDGTSGHLGPLLHLVAGAGRGVHIVCLYPPVPTQEAPAPLVQPARFPLAFGTVAFSMPNSVDDAWCAGLLRLLPGCVRRVSVRVRSDEGGAVLRALVQGLARHVRRPLTLTLIGDATITHELEAELREVVEGAAEGQPGQGLALEVRR